MVDRKTLEDYQPTIGIECHVQLNTKTKLFARVSNDAKGAEPNTTVSPICFGLPGVLPYLNEGAIEMAVKAGLTLNAEINHFSKFDRKHYFYPDLPKGYQVTQYDQPIVGQGYVEVPIGEETVRVGIERAHLEEDAGKLTHPESADYSLVDLNRAGTPLLEIVSQPDIKSPKAAKAYVRELYLLMKYVGVSDVDLYHGHMRFDVNISVAKKGIKTLGIRAEVKNLNSFKAVEKAAQYEFERQVELLERGEKVVQETRGWHDAKQKTFSQRGKEEAHDYRYFPEPDLPPVELRAAFIKRLEKDIPDMPGQLRLKLLELGLGTNEVEALIEHPDVLPEINKLARISEDKARFGANLLLNTWLADETTYGRELLFGAEYISVIHGLFQDDQISSDSVKQLFWELQATERKRMKDDDIKALAEKEGLIQISDEPEIGNTVRQVIADNPKAVEDYKAGEQKAIGFLTGQVMKASQGRANPKVVQNLLKKNLGK